MPPHTVAAKATRPSRPRALSPKGVEAQALEAHAEEILALVEETPDMTLGEIAAHLEAERGLRVSQSTVWRFFDRRDITFKKNRARQRTTAP